MPATDPRPCSTCDRCKKDGTLTAISLACYGTAGVGHGRGHRHGAQASTPAPTSHSRSPTSSPTRARPAPCARPAIRRRFALEQAIDELAEKLGIDPLALRDKIDPSPVRREERRIGAERFGWHRRHAPGADPGPIKRGLGVAQSLWGAMSRPIRACEVRMMRDGSVEVLSSVQDIGTGIGTVLAQVVAEVLGLRPEDITVRIGDTEFPPGRPRTAAGPRPPSRRRRAPPPGASCRCSSAKRRSRSNAGSRGSDGARRPILAARRTAAA